MVLEAAVKPHGIMPLSHFKFTVKPFTPKLFELNGNELSQINYKSMKSTGP